MPLQAVPLLVIAAHLFIRYHPLPLQGAVELSELSLHRIDVRVEAVFLLADSRQKGVEYLTLGALYLGAVIQHQRIPKEAGVLKPLYPGSKRHRPTSTTAGAA